MSWLGTNVTGLLVDQPAPALANHKLRSEVEERKLRVRVAFRPCVGFPEIFVVGHVFHLSCHALYRRTCHLLS